MKPIYRIEKIKGWNNRPSIRGKVCRPERIDGLADWVKDSKTPLLARGGGTSFGDSSITGDGLNVDMTRLNKMLDFDSESGILHCQAGLTIYEIVESLGTRGWFLKTTPGTQYATIGGCIACDAHGKNWEAGSFCNSVLDFSLMVQDGQIIRCGRNTNTDVFFATIGGMGMTGLILDARIQLKKIQSLFIDLETIQFKSLKECFDLQYDSMKSHEYIFSWLDTQKEGQHLGRGILQRANHCADDRLFYKRRRRFNVPFYLPGFAVNRYSVNMFNACYYYRTKKRNIHQVPVVNFFYPLDSIGSWYRVYGKKGYIEYQVVIPFESAYDAVSRLLEKISRSKLGSNVAAVKPLIDSDGILSFSLDGFTFAADFIINKKLWPLLDELDEIVAKNGGRVYLAKDARLAPDMFTKMYAGPYNRWKPVVEKVNPGRKFSSMLFDRVCHE